MNKITFGILLFVLDLCFAFETNAQQFKIISAEDGASLPFATLINYTHPNLMSANANGVAEFRVQNGDSIAVSYVGFTTTSFVYNSNTSSNIRLFKESSVLPPITVLRCKKMKQMKYSNKNSVNYRIKENGERVYCDGIGWWGGYWKNSYWAVRLNPAKENTQLKSFSFWLEKHYFGPQSAIKAPLIISFYDVTDSILPGNELTDLPLIYYPQRTGKQTLNLDSFHLRIPPNGIYVSFQCVTNDEYAWTHTVHFRDSTRIIIKDTSLRKSINTNDRLNAPNKYETRMVFIPKDSTITVTCYGGSIDAIYTKDFELAGYNPIKNNWFLLSTKTGEKELHGSIKCEAVLKYCED
jgi:hypothetical protein